MKENNRKSEECCTSYHELLSDSLDGSTLTRETGEHLKDCENCRRYLDEITAIHNEALKENLIEVPQELKLNVMSKIKVLSSERKERSKTARFALSRVIIPTTITLIPLSILIAGFPLNEVLPLTYTDISYALSPVTEFLYQSVTSISDSGAILTESIQSLISVFQSAPALIPSLSFSTSVSTPLISTFVLLTLIVNLFLLTKSGNFQPLRERRTIHGFI